MEVEMMHNPEHGKSAARHPVPGRLEQRSTRIVFFIAGFGISVWAPLVPYLKDRTGVDKEALGMLLLCLGMGSLIAMPLAGAFSTRFGCRAVLMGGALVMCAMLPLLSVLSWLPAVAAALFVFGLGVGTVDCGVNILSVIVQRSTERPLMSGFHGLFSVGGIAGSAAMSALLGIGLPPLASVLIAVLLTLAALIFAARHLIPYGEAKHEGGFMFPRGIVLFLGTLCFIVFLAEGAMLDWSAVFLVDFGKMPQVYSGLGYSTFAAAMTLGRLTGDRVVRALGNTTIVLGGGLCAAFGLVLATLHPAWQAGLAGFALVGLGCSNIVPVMYSMISRQKVMPAAAAVPAITTMGFSGILTGPALIGFLAQHTSLATAFLMIAGALVAVAVSSRWLRGR